mgnify:CR=1 FL=1
METFFTSLLEYQESEIIEKLKSKPKYTLNSLGKSDLDKFYATLKHKTIKYGEEV